MSARKQQIFLVLAIALVSCAFCIMVQVIFSNYCRELKGSGFVSYIDEAAVQKGYVLAAPNYADKFFDESGNVQLIDLAGNVVHRWETKYIPMYASLEPDGSIFVEMTPPADIASTPAGGKTGLIQRISWDGRVLWEYADGNMHHDFEVLPDGSVAFLSWVAMPSGLANKVVGGMVSNLATTSTVWSDAIVVVNADKQIVWRWNLFEHIDISKYTLNSFTPSTDWSHANSIRYLEDNPITHVPAYLISVRHINAVFMVEAESGTIVWESSPKIFAFQHDATLLDNGNILAFDNGLFRSQDRPYLWSRAVEINPLTNKIVWQYKGGKTGTESAQFASSIMGGAQRLENGNTLITYSTQNRVIEVTPEGKIVWDYANRFTDPEGRQFILFKVRKYDSAGTAWGEYLNKNLNFNSFCPA